MCQAFNLTLLAPFYRKVNRLRIKGPPPLRLMDFSRCTLVQGKARAELRPARRQARLPHSRSLLLHGI